MTTTAIEFTEAEIAHRKACAYLKGYLVAASSTAPKTSPRTPEFAAGLEDGNKVCTVEGVTLAHIIHNRLRHNKPHRMSGKRHYDAGYTDFDQSHIDYMRTNSPYFTNKLLSKLANYGAAVVELMDKEVE
jgi:hypothetical protein